MRKRVLVVMSVCLSVCHELVLETDNINHFDLGMNSLQMAIYIVLLFYFQADWGNM